MSTHLLDFLLLASGMLAACAISVNMGFFLAKSRWKPLAVEAMELAKASLEKRTEATTGHAAEKILRMHMEKRHAHELALCHERIQYLQNEMQNLRLLNIPAAVVTTPTPKKKAGKRANASGLN